MRSGPDMYYVCISQDIDPWNDVVGPDSTIKRFGSKKEALASKKVNEDIYHVDLNIGKAFKVVRLYD